LTNIFGYDFSLKCQKRQKGDKPMKFTITNVETKQQYEFESKEFRKKLASFLVLYEVHKTDEEKESIFARFELARQSKVPFIYESTGYKFMVMPKGRES
jgi:hypothetical protein